MTKPKPKKKIKKVPMIKEVFASSKPEEFKADLQQPAGNRFNAVRRETLCQLREISKAPGSMLSPEVLARFLNKSYRTIYRWLSVDFISLPKLRDCEIMASFLSKVQSLRGEWRPLAEKWETFGFRAVEKDIRLALFNPKLLSILEAGDLTPDEKIEELVMRTLRTLAKM